MWRPLATLTARALRPKALPLQRRPYPRLFCGVAPKNGDREAACAFIVERGYSPEVAAACVDVLSAPGSGVPQGGLLNIVKAMAGRPEVGEDAGLLTLLKSVEQDLAHMSGAHVVHFTVYPPKGVAPFKCEAIEGMSIKDVAQHGKGTGAEQLREYIECACSGVMACSTCQVYVHPVWFPKVGKPSEAEMDMLELAYEPTETSRLGCQLKLTPEVDGLEVSIPDGTNNKFDHFPFE